ncbi:MAG: DUF2726 domain-containing protein [Planctomycetaceae bacterium]|nr:DUF2726 domain-containing protein [Planctomycetaceae bacterium]
MSEDSEPLGCLGFILKLFGIDLGQWGGSASGMARLPYRLRDDFLSPAELSFYRVLQAAVGDEWAICCKVRLADLFFVPRGDGDTAHRNRIDRKHVDFLLCDPRTMQPRLGIELDDASHNRVERQERDKLVDDVFDAAELPLLRIPAARTYQKPQVIALVKGALADTPRESLPETTTDAVPVCPKCGVPMVRRTASKGRNQGAEFWGCANYPHCRQVVQV